ncbi:TIGR04255 family protein [Herbaspirillum robiniae]|uniref:TIGR04255 family protein n=1 Tax=Herbaspirillum robiniae TaxID=2014887 RepID=A0A246WQ31_9BURK|nr:TIGR04255 family protein [Herbaspirillum robiniae]OWY28489.1 hypothetical protein CEJ42_14755 [Herbaspirillum robiniae]
MSVARPDGLPDFLNPPLNEVVMGVQFSRPKGYQQIYAGQVWQLFKDQYPVVQEQPALPPAFETFGLQQQIFPPPPGFGFFSGAMHDRFWFLTSKGEELLQFQEDKLLHNWRKIGDETNEYPRFESVIDRFGDELGKLQEFMTTLSGQQLLINQCEVSYINHIVFTEALPTPQHWLNFVNFQSISPNDVSMVLRETILDDEQRPQARLTYEISIGQKSGQQMMNLGITFRGIPKTPNLPDVLAFLNAGRLRIVTRFAEITTTAAHEYWGKK